MDKNIVLRVAMKAVIVREDGKFLILREAGTYLDGTQTGRYHMPGGRINPGENFEDALRRVVKEESGLEIEIGMPIYVGEWRPVIRGVQNQIIATFIVCRTNSKEITLSEHDSFEWVTAEESEHFDIMEPEDKVIEKYAELLAKKVF